MDALVTAGGIPTPDEPLYQYTQGLSKALANVAGKPMIQWILDALSGSQLIENVIIIGLEDEHGLTCSKPLTYLPNQGGMIDNIRFGTAKMVELNPDAKFIALVSSDIPTITAEMVDWVVKTAEEANVDLTYNVVERSTMEKRFPGSNRTFTKLKGIEICGGDMNVVSIHAVMGQGGLWDRLADARKNVFKQASLIGFDTLFLVLTRMVDLDGAARQIEKRLGLPAKAILCPYAEVAMDVDKPHQLELLAADLAKG